jgi:hypothetical protein
VTSPALPPPTEAEPQIMLHAKTWGFLREIYQSAHTFVQAQVGVYAASREIRASSDAVAKAERSVVFDATDSFDSLKKALVRAKVVVAPKPIGAQTPPVASSVLQTLLQDNEKAVVRVPRPQLAAQLLVAEALCAHFKAVSVSAKREGLLSGLAADSEQLYVGPRLQFVMGQVATKLDHYAQLLTRDKHLAQLRDQAVAQYIEQPQARPEFVASRYPSL